MSLWTAVPVRVKIRVSRFGFKSWSIVIIDRLDKMSKKFANAGSRRSMGGSSRGSRGGSDSDSKSSIGANVGALTLLEKRMLEKKSG
jgi:hypothetical protein